MDGRNTSGYLFGVHFNGGVTGVVWAVITAESLLTILAYIGFRRGRWLTMDV
ncbi:MAG: hypothetical protein R2795_24225 [Saprospiraceae bacterium]